HALARIALRDAADAQVQTAVLSSAPRHLATVLDAVLADGEAKPPSDLIEQLLALAVATSDNATLANALTKIAKPGEAQTAAWQFSAVAGVLDGLARKNVTLAKFAAKAPPELR